MKKNMIIPDSKEHLKAILINEMEIYGNECDLNHLDVSNITDMESLFSQTKFNGKINQWDVSNVTNMSYLFERSEFNGDISNWDVSNVQYMIAIFRNSKFNNDIKKWNVSNVISMYEMFSNSKFSGDISNWNVSKVQNMRSMFQYSEFNGDLNNWIPLNLKVNFGILLNSKLANNNLPWWAGYTDEQLKNGAVQKYLDNLDFKEKLSTELEYKQLDNKKVKI